MKVLVAGATGAIGRPLISALVASRREVIGITTTERGARTLRDRGAEAFIADVLDRDAIEAVFRKIKPDAVIDELTSLPKEIYARGNEGGCGARLEIETGWRAQPSGCGDLLGRKALHRAVHRIFLRTWGRARHRT